MKKEDNQNIQAIQDFDSLELYNKIYALSKKDYKVVKTKEIIRKSFSFIILLLSIAGIFSIFFYFGFQKDHINNLKNKVSILDKKINELSIEELEYERQLNFYTSLFKNLKIEDNRLVDVDLSNTVSRSVRNVDENPAEYKNIYRGNINFKETALTFDLGTGNDLAEIYTIIKRFDIKVTIFISNEMPSLNYGSLFNNRNIHYLKKMGDLGCEFGNHTWSHYNLKASLYEVSKSRRIDLVFISDDVLNDFTARLEFDRVRKKFYEKTGYLLTNLWRAPYGAIDKRILTIASKAGYPNHVLWSSNSLGPLDFFDYANKRYILVKDQKTGKIHKKKNPYYFSSSEMLLRMKEWEKIDKNGLNGAISIAHLGTSRKIDKMINILPDYISYFKGKGYHFVTVSQLINNKKDY